MCWLRSWKSSARSYSRERGGLVVVGGRDLGLAARPLVGGPAYGVPSPSATVSSGAMPAASIRSSAAVGSSAQPAACSRAASANAAKISAGL